MIRLDKCAATYIIYPPTSSLFCYVRLLRKARHELQGGLSVTLLWFSVMGSQILLSKNGKNGTEGQPCDLMHTKCTERYATLCVANRFACSAWYCLPLFSLTLSDKVKTNIEEVASCRIAYFIQLNLVCRFIGLCRLIKNYSAFSEKLSIYK